MAAEVGGEGDLSVFKDAITEDNISIQVDAVKRLPLLASALDVVRTREELIPCLAECVDAMADELCFHLAEQLERFVPLVGGAEHVNLVLDILVKLACEDEMLVRERAVQAMGRICADLDEAQCERAFYPVIERLATSDWFTTKCSAGCLITICYSKLAAERQAELRNVFRNLAQDDSPMVRRFTASSLLEFVSLLDVDHLKAEFVPVFDNLALDEQDSVRTLAVDLGVAISKHLKEFEIAEYLLSTFKVLGVDYSWRVRQRVAWKLYEIRCSDKYREEMIDIYKTCVRDEEQEVRVFAAKNLYNFSLTLMESFQELGQSSEDAFEHCFEEDMTPEIHYMITDMSEEVRVALSSNILSLSSLLRNECFNTHILPLVIDALENEEFMPFKENMLKNLSSLPTNVDITKSLKSIKNVIKNLLENSQMHWRTRRNLLLAFTHITRNTTSDFFDENLKIFYQYLLNDPIFAIRRTSPVILPLLVKQFGMNWAKDSLIPTFVLLAKDHRYLYRYSTLFGVDELICPTLNQEQEESKSRYLTDLKEQIQASHEPKKFIETLVKIVKLNQKLSTELSGSVVCEEPSHCNDNISFYAEDTLETLKKEQKMAIFSIRPEEIGDNTICYLEGVLLILIKVFLKVIKDLIKDPIRNVQQRAQCTINNIKNFTTIIQEETGEPWVDEAMQTLTEDDLTRIEEEIKGELTAEKATDNETIDCAMAETTTDPVEVEESPQHSN